MKRIIAVSAVVMLLGGAVALHYGGLGNRITNPQELQQLVLDAGPWGHTVFLLLFTFVAPLGLPGFVFIIAASLIWPLPVAFGLSMIGGIGSAVFGFTFSRYLARDWVARHLPQRLRRFDARLAEHGVRSVILIYLLFFLAPPTHWLLGLSRVRFPSFLAGCVIGILPGTLALSFLGGNLVDVFLRFPLFAWTVVVLLGLGLLYRVISSSRRTGDGSDV